MSKFLRSLADGSLRCRYCGDKECDCMEDGITIVRIIGIWNYRNHPYARYVQLAKQKLPNGKQIPSDRKIWIPARCIFGINELLKKIEIDNDFLNRLRFD